MAPDQLTQPETPEWYCDPRCEKDSSGFMARHRPRCHCGWRSLKGAPTPEPTVEYFGPAGLPMREPIQIEGPSEHLKNALQLLAPREPRRTNYEWRQDAEAIRRRILAALAQLEAQ